MNTRDTGAAVRPKAATAPKELTHFVGGKHVKGESTRFGDVFNPTTGALASRVPLASKAEVERVIANAKEAFTGWSETSPVTRARVMFRFKELVEKHIDELALLVSSEHGKVLSDAKGSVQRGLEVVEFACGIPHLIRASTPTTSPRGWTCTRSASRSAYAPASRRSTSRRWCRCGCSPWRSPAATASS
jgi:acyl-CoA reductase-like NAD-dependent aldehyde dehydrogenase